MNNENWEKKLNNILELEEYYSLEDFGGYNMIQSQIHINSFSNTNKSYVRVTFPFNGKAKEVIKEKNELKNIYSFIKIYSNQTNYINILINNNNKEYNNPNNIIKKINENYHLKSAIKINLKINEFPLKNYMLIPKEQIFFDFDKVFILTPIQNINNNINKNILNNNNQNIQNKISSNFNMPLYFNNNNKNNNYNIINHINNNTLNNNNCYVVKIEELENLLNKEKNKNKELNSKINELEISLNEKIKENNNLNKRIIQLEELLKIKEKEIGKLNEFNNNFISADQKEWFKIINKNKILIEELKSKLARYPFELLPGEKMMSVIFNSTKQDINYSVICKNTDLFVNIELKLYKEYPQYKENENFFTVGGNKINKYINLEQNKIKDNDIILLNQF